MNNIYHDLQQCNVVAVCILTCMRGFVVLLVYIARDAVISSMDLASAFPV